MTVTRLNMRIDDDLKQQAKEVYNDMEMDLTTAIIIFLKQSVREQRLPFQPSREPIENVIARYEVDNNLTTKVNSIDKLMESLNADD
ncbi:type II toxin-antitoxin system RelB/DinJ family antitoxin [Carnobacterium maltaromaticum]|uniref:type II toxin-antitoxin system RelB/DinJ family antitoxin n=1 Tax=Carnobacterium maltaromaticum TaxID=2751 RepID=UPI00295E4827|nr:type II toxin-antitoxin system RelB/DinJ family antitoxin [Carnobacterium maltaromaticum]